MALVIFLLSFLALAQDCPPERVLPALPVHDQDGLGSCASNTAALLMQHNLGLAQSPSYYQLSLTVAGKEKSAFFYNDEQNRERLFNYGAHVCEVIKSARVDGYCDAAVFELDVIGSQDPERSKKFFSQALGAT